MAERSTTLQNALESRVSSGDVELHEFLLRELPSARADQAAYLALALQEAGARYDRYTARRNDWLNYRARRRQLRRITKLVEDLSSDIYGLDILTRDDLASRVNENDIPALIGLLGLLSKQTAALLNEIQDSGRPRELAEERWIVEVADIYENAFGRPASVSGSRNDPSERRGKFYRLLELCRPMSFPRAGKLSVVQIGRVLERRRARNPKTRGLLACVRTLK
jgi:hypothetical protein